MPVVCHDPTPPDDGSLSQQIAGFGRVVLVDDDVKDAPRSLANNKDGALADRYRIELGHKRIAHVSEPSGMTRPLVRNAIVLQKLAAKCLSGINRSI
jgi:hypothetical protein